MIITYKVWRDDNTNIEHHGKPTSKQCTLCFKCAVKAAMNEEIIETKTALIEYYCDDCGS